MKKLAIITTHPIQYNAPLFRMLNERKKISARVFYTWGEDVLIEKYDPGFGKNVSWDIPLLEGYDHVFLKNISKTPGSHHYNGIDNPDLINEIVEWKPDAVLVYGWAFKSHSKALRYFKSKIPVLFRGDSTSIKNLNPAKKLVRKFFLRWIYSHIDYALYVGTNNRLYYEDLGIKAKQLRFAPHAIDNQRFEKALFAGKQDIETIKKDLGINRDDIIIMYAGKIDENKNVRLLLQVFCDLKRDDVQLFIVGNGILENELHVSYGNKKNVHFLPFQNQSKMPWMYGLSDIFVLPSFSETWGLAINEAMACKNAILASSGCGCAIDLVKEGENGYIFRNNDKSDLKNKLNKILASTEAMHVMGERSNEIIKSWTFEKSCDQIEDILINSN